jgi:deazaflavin-dependent oxidoreductase (nitroreductase family)
MINEEETPMTLSRRVARFNRAFANHLAGPMFTRLPGFGTVHHRGRKTRRNYTTPVKLFRSGDEYIIALPYGTGADWVRNVLADGGCEITAGGERVPVGEPRIVADDGLPAVPAVTRWMLSRIGSNELLVLSQVRDARQRVIADGKPFDAS